MLKPYYFKNENNQKKPRKCFQKKKNSTFAVSRFTTRDICIDIIISFQSYNYILLTIDLVTFKQSFQKNHVNLCWTLLLQLMNREHSLQSESILCCILMNYWYIRLNFVNNMVYLLYFIRYIIYIWSYYVSIYICI